MDSSGNHQDTGPMAGWSIVVVHGKILVGKLVGVTMSPVYEMVDVVAMSPNGPQQATVLIPLCKLPSVKSITLANPGIVIDMSQLDKDERRAFAHMVDTVEKGIAQARAAAAGILIAPPGAKVRMP